MTVPGTDLVAEIAEAVRAEQLATVGELGRDALLWLVAAPLWTQDAAERAGFPAHPVIGFVKRARAEGWCETRGSLRGDGEPGLCFWVPVDLRRDVLDLLTQGGSRQRLVSDARVAAGSVAQRVLRGGTEEDSGPDVPDALGYWAQLLPESEPDRALVDLVARAVDADDLPAAQHMVSAGEAMEPLLAGTMTLAVDRARRLLSLGSRRRQDARALARYLDRPELSAAVGALLRPGTGQWALHLRGVGGVGKTMMVRYLASGQYAAERDEPPLTIARVDFDHMSPDYPVRRPVQLLLELADELALHAAAVGPADDVLSQFKRMAKSVHESLSSVREEHASPMRNPAVLAAIDTFADTLRLLPRPLLILDTCEELAKADAGDPAAPAVSNTLAIIERIHDRAPEVRVLLAGRRRLPARDYLAVTPVGGFTTGEATRYLTTFAARRLPDELIRAIIRQSPAIDGPPAGPGQLPSRVSPFDLALYREWAEEDPGLDTARVERGTHAYVEGRIIERLDDLGVRRALPVLATAGRCRVTTIAAFLGADPALLGPRLAEQEWIESAGDPPTHVTAGPALALRLRRYFGEPVRSAVFTAETARLAALLSQQVRDVPLDDVDGDELLAALRLSEPADAARLWDELADRAAAAGRWSWLFNITRRVSGEAAEAAWPTEGALRATVVAASIAASRQQGIPGYNPVAPWAEVRRSAHLHPDAEAARWLLTRAALGTLGRTPDDTELWTALRPSFGRYGSAARMAGVAAATADTLHQLLEAGEEAAARRLWDRAAAEWHEAGLPSINPGQHTWTPAAPDAARLWRDHPQLHVWLLIAFARMTADTNLSSARHALVEAGAKEKALMAAGGTARSWPDAILPADLLARRRIEEALIGWAEHGGADSTWMALASTFLSDAGAAKLTTIDGERLASLCLQRWLDYAVIEAPLVERWEEADTYAPGRVATSSAHDLVPPLFVSLAEAWLAAGRPQRALDHVARHRQQALDTHDDEATVRHADATTARIARRLRLDDQLALLSRLASPENLSPDRLALADDARRTIAVVRGEPPQYAGADVTGRPAGWHAWWQCQPVPVGPVPPVLWDPAATDTVLAADIELDLYEFGRVSQTRQQQLIAQPGLASWLARPRQAPAARSAEPYRQVRAGLRRSALSATGNRFLLPDSETPSGPRQVPGRLLAEMAFDEAELLALRFPAAAAQLFRTAADSYAAADDEANRVLAELALVTTVLTAQKPGEPPDALALNRFHAALAALPPGAEVPFRAASDAGGPGPWRYWARQLAQVPAPAQTSPSGARRPVARRASPFAEFWRALGDGALELAQDVADWAEDVAGKLRDLKTAGPILLAGVGLGLAEAAAIALWTLIARLPGFGPLIVAGRGCGDRGRGHRRAALAARVPAPSRPLGRGRHRVPPVQPRVQRAHPPWRQARRAAGQPVDAPALAMDRAAASAAEDRRDRARHAGGGDAH